MLSITRDAAPRGEEFNPFEDQNSSHQVGDGNKKRFMLRLRLWMCVDQFLTPFAVHLLKIAIHICPNVFHYGQYTLNGRFYSRDALPVWTSFGKHFVIRPVIRL